MKDHISGLKRLYFDDCRSERILLYEASACYEAMLVCFNDALVNDGSLSEIFGFA